MMFWLLILEIMVKARLMLSDGTYKRGCPGRPAGSKRPGEFYHPGTDDESVSLFFNGSFVNPPDERLADDGKVFAPETSCQGG